MVPCPFFSTGLKYGVLELHEHILGIPSDLVSRISKVGYEDDNGSSRGCKVDLLSQKELLSKGQAGIEGPLTLNP